MGDRGGVVHLSADEVRESNHDRYAVRRLRDLLHALPVLDQKLRLEQQVFGRVAGNGELRERYEVGS